MATMKYFSGTQELRTIYPISNKQFSNAFPGIKGRRSDGFSIFVGEPLDGDRATLPVTRIIEYKRNPSLHKCDARCQNAKGRTCECSCGGKYHGHAA
jgi:hypothetical protein